MPNKKDKAEKATKKSFLNVSKKEKQVLLILGGVAALAGYYFLVVDPMFATRGQLESQLQTVRDEHAAARTKAATEKQLNADITQLKQETLQVAKNYYGDTNQGEFIFLIDKLLKDSNIVLSDITFEEFAGSFAEESSSTESSAVQTAPVAGSSASSGTTTATTESATTNATSGDAATEPTAPATAPMTAEQKVNNSNIKLMTADIAFKNASYGQLLQFLRSVDQNNQRIVSTELEMKSPQNARALANGDEAPDTGLEGRILLRFYQVVDVEKYVEKPASMVDASNIQRNSMTHPFQRYAWAQIQEQATALNTDTNGNGGSLAAPQPTVPIVTQPQIPGVTNPVPNGPNMIAVARSQTIYGFEKDLPLINDGAGNVAVQQDGVDKQEGSYATQVTFQNMVPGKMVQLNLEQERIVLTKAPDSLTFNLYRNKNTDQPKQVLKAEVGLRVADANGREVYLKVLNQVDWDGWRTVRFDLSDIKTLSYPYTIKGVYFIYHDSYNDTDVLKLDNFAIMQTTVN